MSETKKKNHKLTQFWKHRIKQWSESGVSQNKSCRQNDLGSVDISTQPIKAAAKRTKYI